jgi:hypothetical protein
MRDWRTLLALLLALAVLFLFCACDNAPESPADPPSPPTDPSVNEPTSADQPSDVVDTEKENTEENGGEDDAPPLPPVADDPEFGNDYDEHSTKRY